MLLFLVAGGASLAPLRAETTMSDDQRKNLFLESKKGMPEGSPSPQHTPKPRPKPKGSPKTKPKSSPRPNSGQAPGSSPKKHRATHTPQASKEHGGSDSWNPPPPSQHGAGDTRPASTAKKAVETTERHPSPGGLVDVSPPPSPSAVPLPHGAEPSAPITIEKSGVETAQGFQPLAESASSARGFWGRLFGGSARTYHYLSPSLRSAIDRAPVRRGRWKYIVVHNSGTREGNARVFDIYHRRVRHMVNGLAYHFVIGDGHGSGDGQIEVGHRWTAQLNGGHVASDYLNDIALGVCLVGDFNRDEPTKEQIGALEELVDYLRNRVGKNQGRRAIVYAHKEINPRPTDCPGSRFPYGWLHAKFGNAR